MKKFIRKMKKAIFSNPKTKRLFIKFINLFGGNDKIDKSNIAKTVVLKKIKVEDKGKENRIIIGENSKLNNCSFKFYGNDNKVIIGENCNFNNMHVWIEDNNNKITIGNSTTIHGNTKFSCMEGTCIDIGEDCMFLSNIMFRTGDSHSIVDLQGERINNSKNIYLGNHVWVGQNAFVGKGASVADNSVIGACAVVTKKFDTTNIAIGGNPAKIIKEKINWKRERV